MDDFADRLGKAIRRLEDHARDLERRYGGGGYDPSESVRLAGKIQGMKLALSYYEEMNRG